MALNMHQKRNFGRFYSSVIVLLFFLLALFYTLWNVFISSSNIFSLLVLKNSNTPIEGLLKYEKERYDYLYTKKQQIDENPNFFMKKFAAEYMQMQRPNEQILILPKNLQFKNTDENPK